jgi:hypothetical protein
MAGENESSNGDAQGENVARWEVVFNRDTFAVGFRGDAASFEFLKHVFQMCEETCDREIKKATVIAMAHGPVVVPVRGGPKVPLS